MPGQDGLASLLRSMGGEIETGVRVDSLAQLPASRLVLLDVTPRQFIRIAGDRLLPAYRRRLERYRYGPGVFKMDWALNAPVPWRAEGCRRAGTIHLGGTLAEIAASERDAWKLLQRIHYHSPKQHDAGGQPVSGSRLIHARVIPAHPLRDFAAK